MTRNHLINKSKQKVRKKRVIRNREPSKILPYLVMFALLILIPLWQRLFTLATRWSYLKVKEIEIKGNYRITSEQIRLWTGVKEGLNMLNFDLSRVSSVAEAQPWIRSGVVERKFPDILSIQVEENMPVVIWEDGGNLFLMDEFGFLLEGIQEKEKYSSLPVLTCLKKMGSKAGQRCPFPYWSNGLSVVENIRVVMPEIIADVLKICILSEDQVIIFLTNGRKVLLSMSTSRMKFPLLKGLIEKIPDQWQTMGYCDLRFDGKIIFG